VYSPYGEKGQVQPLQVVKSYPELSTKIGLPLTLENDNSAAAWGEFRFGAGGEVDHLVFVGLGTGIGGGVISHGVLLRGTQGSGWRARPRHHPRHRAPLRLRQPRLPRSPRLRHRHSAEPVSSPSRDLAEIKASTLGPQSGVLGAAALARDPSSGEYVLRR
jgi:hypothetical protein